MPLSFRTLSQQFVFVDPLPLFLPPPMHSLPANRAVDPEAVLPNHTYNVYLVIENSDSVAAFNVQVDVWHSAFGIGRPAGTDGLTQPLPVMVPPAEYGVPGTATVAFTFTSPPGGHGCLGAQIEGTGAYIGQNITVTSCPSGEPSILSFLVFGGGAAEHMILTCEETGPAGPIAANAAASWHPLLIAPAGTGPTGPTVAPITLSLGVNVFDSVGLQVTVPPGATDAHTFHIVGTVSGAFVGEVDITVNAVPGLARPHPFVAGGYHSADILLFDGANQPIPAGGPPNAATDTLLLPNHPYKISAMVHNDSPTPAVNTVVRFWQIPGGNALNGTLIDARSVTVPGNGSIQVDSHFPFVSAAPGLHSCAAVSVYNSLSTNATTDPNTASAIPNPNADIGHSASAWRNTDSMYVFIGKPWQFTIRTTALPKVQPVLKATTVVARAGLEATPAVTAVNKSLLQVGARAIQPIFLAPAVRLTLPEADLKVAVGNFRGVGDGLNEHTISGVVPADAKPGDRYLTTVVADYGDQRVEFLQTLYVKG